MSPHEIQRLIENLKDEASKPLLKEVFTPKGTGPVATSPDFVFIVTNVIRGLSPIEIADLVEKDKRRFITAEAIRDYVLQHVPPQLIRPHMMEKWLAKLPEVDPLQTLQLLERIMMQEVMAFADKPAPDFDSQESRRRTIDAARKIAFDRHKIQMDRQPKASKPAHPMAPEKPMEETPQVLAEVASDSIDPRDASDAMQALKDLGVLN